MVAVVRFARSRGQHYNPDKPTAKGRKQRERQLERPTAALPATRTGGAGRGLSAVAATRLTGSVTRHYPVSIETPAERAISTARSHGGHEDDGG
jgi:hypothetical protein